MAGPIGRISRRHALTSHSCQEETACMRQAFTKTQVGGLCLKFDPLYAASRLPYIMPNENVVNRACFPQTPAENHYYILLDMNCKPYVPDHAHALTNA
eukprot:gnl/MRDRNA2_/MRDRNA2_86053_c0_seq2.p1 gnl/MRDRNA2_/MRDRNA2_86053_c0~~gnl/MRDRNA2_/MRDRNA2_86053_c0_seq2.p1  ORF type:complete len:110 (-),score=4.83 gnl/MRDRNA2_/MRDRNA2_86053_c0_seq2:859-1152(-)